MCKNIDFDIIIEKYNFASIKYEKYYCDLSNYIPFVKYINLYDYSFITYNSSPVYT